MFQASLGAVACAVFPDNHEQCYPAVVHHARGLGFQDYRALCGLVDSGTHGHPGGIGWTDAAKTAAAVLARNGLRLSVRLDGSPRIVAEMP